MAKVNANFIIWKLASMFFNLWVTGTHLQLIKCFLYHLSLFKSGLLYGSLHDLCTHSELYVLFIFSQIKYFWVKKVLLEKEGKMLEDGVRSSKKLPVFINFIAKKIWHTFQTNVVCAVLWWIIFVHSSQESRSSEYEEL